MIQTDKAALTDRLSNIGMVTPTLAEGQTDMVRDIETITGEILEAKRVGGEAIITIGQRLIEAKYMLEHGEWLPWLKAGSKRDKDGNPILPRKRKTEAA